MSRVFDTALKIMSVIIVIVNFFSLQDVINKNNKNAYKLRKMRQVPLSPLKKCDNSQKNCFHSLKKHTKLPKNVLSSVGDA
jgi:hypothetical protein